MANTSNSPLLPSLGNPRAATLSRVRRRLSLTLLAGVAVFAGAVTAALTRHHAAQPQGHYETATFTFHGDGYSYLVYLPVGYRDAAPLPLVVVLHGCQTTAGQQAAVSGYAPIADRRRLIVLYPDVDVADQENGGCWKGIWQPRGERVGQGDAGAIATMTRAVMRTHRIDARRVYLIGMSAGAFEASILGATYPTVYAAIGIHSGAAYMDGLACVDSARTAQATPALARAALKAMASHARVMPVIVIHGDRDDRVPYRCGEQAVAQWVATDDLVLTGRRRPTLPDRRAATRTGQVPGGHSYTVADYRSREACPMVELWTVHGMGHFWSGGTRAPSLARYSDPLGPSAAAASIDFFLRWRLSSSCPPTT